MYLFITGIRVSVVWVTCIILALMLMMNIVSFKRQRMCCYTRVISIQGFISMIKQMYIKIWGWHLWFGPARYTAEYLISEKNLAIHFTLYIKHLEVTRRCQLSSQELLWFKNCHRIQISCYQPYTEVAISSTKWTFSNLIIQKFMNLFFWFLIKSDNPWFTVTAFLLKSVNPHQLFNQKELDLSQCI